MDKKNSTSAKDKRTKKVDDVHRPLRKPHGVASRRRLKLDEAGACYHVMSQMVNGESLRGEEEKKEFRQIMWRMANFAGVEILTYAIMNDHFHILLKVPEREKWLKRFAGEEGEENFLQHLSVVYSKSFLKKVRQEIDYLRAEGDEKEIEKLLNGFKERMCDVSKFMKELKERFTRYFNKAHGRRGTLWMDRFKSVLVEPGSALKMMAAYIDLNPVRSKLVHDPQAYPWTGYAEAEGGSRRARRGLCKVLQLAQDSWERKAHEVYRELLSGKKEATGESGTEQYDEELLKPRANFSNGVAIGSEDYVKGVGKKYRRVMKRRRARQPKELKLAPSEEETSVYILRKRKAKPDDNPAVE